MATNNNELIMLNKYQALATRAWVNGNKVIVETETIKGHTYAFYFHHSKGIEKEFYKERNAFEFDFIPLENCITTVSFFYKDIQTGKAERVDKKYSYNKDRNTLYEFEPKIIEETDGHLIEEYNIDSDVTFIVFSPAGCDKKSVTFGLYFLINKGFNLISCKHDDNFFQTLSFERFKNLVSPLIQGKKVFLYGSSLGAYASIYFAGAVNGTAIAAAPRNPYHPELRSHKINYDHLEFTHSCLSKVQQTTENVYVFLDKYDVTDMYFYSTVIQPYYKKISLFSVDYAGHEVLIHLNRTHQLSDLISNIVFNDKIEINPELESEYTLLGRIRIFYQLERYRDVEMLSNRILSSSEYSETSKNTANFYLNKLNSQSVLKA